VAISIFTDVRNQKKKPRNNNPSAVGDANESEIFVGIFGKLFTELFDEYIPNERLFF
jgi:hypothetical protein